MWNEKTKRLEAELISQKELYASVKAVMQRLIDDKDREIERLREEGGQLRGKISLMETILMPLSSKAGAAYQALVNPPAKNPATRTIVEPPASEWQSYKRKKEQELEEQYAAEDSKGK